jgi:ATP-dependent protease ClpP protease subunit
VVTPNEDFRPNPDRALYLSGTIGQATIDKLTSQVITLRAKSSSPITLYVDSPGGDPSFGDRLLRLIRMPDQDNFTPCRVVAVVTGVAASAAADVMLAADYAIAYPSTILLLHGVRVAPSSNDRLTKERAQALASNLEAENEKYAIRLARNCIDRFILRYALKFPHLADYRREYKLSSTLTDIEVFAESIKEHVAKDVREVVDQALQRSKRSERLDRFATPRVAEFVRTNGLPNTTQIEIQAVLLKAIIDFEIEDNQGKKWDFHGGGLAKVAEDFLLLEDTANPGHDSAVSSLASNWASSFLSPEEAEQLKLITDEKERTATSERLLDRHLRPAWFFFVSLCKFLQQGENYLTADEAYHLGLIDEIIGRPELLSLRWFAEYAPESITDIDTNTRSSA